MRPPEDCSATPTPLPEPDATSSTEPPAAGPGDGLADAGVPEGGWLALLAGLGLTGAGSVALTPASRMRSLRGTELSAR